MGDTNSHKWYCEVERVNGKYTAKLYIDTDGSPDRFAEPRSYRELNAWVEEKVGQRLPTLSDMIFTTMFGKGYAIVDNTQPREDCRLSVAELQKLAWAGPEEEGVWKPNFYTGEPGILNIPHYTGNCDLTALFDAYTRVNRAIGKKPVLVVEVKNVCLDETEAVIETVRSFGYTLEPDDTLPYSFLQVEEEKGRAILKACQWSTIPVWFRNAGGCWSDNL